MKTLYRSSFEPSLRYLAGRNYMGNVCPDGHRLFRIRFKKTRWCDLCAEELVPGSRGEFCKACDSYDICVSCAETGGRPPQTFAVASAVDQACEASTAIRNNPSVIASTTTIPGIAVAPAVGPACEAPRNRMKLKPKKNRTDNDWLLPWMWLF